ncbi:exported hypothetical protein [Candidatus Zixiibacteriota bacterium]|nr:exported hypothetical protein [candidate division Zixibacteria bacterium]
MQKRLMSLSLAVIVLCLNMVSLAQGPSEIYPFSMKYNPELNLLRVFETPAGYERFPEQKMTHFQAWLTNLPLLPPAMPVALWNGEKVQSYDSIGGVIDLGVGTEQQQDPDIPIQLIMEYLRVAGALNDYPFVVTPTDTMTFGKWLDGTYTFDSRMKLIHTPGPKRVADANEYYRFMSMVMHFITGRTLLLNLSPIDEKDIDPGTLYVQFKNDQDSVGHTAVILDVCANAKGEQLLLVGWGGHPAQSFAVARPFPITDRAWFTVPELKDRLKDYGAGQFYRFKR